MNNASAGVKDVKDLPEVALLDGKLNLYVHAHGSETYKQLQQLFWEAIEAINKSRLRLDEEAEQPKEEVDDESKKRFLELAKNRHLYKVTKRLSGKLSYAQIGDKYYSETLYDAGYNINQLVEDGYLLVVDEPFDWQKDLVGKNVKSVYSYCPQCQTFGVNMPLDNQCGNCGYPKTITYYDAQTINDNLISRSRGKS